jgi:predicted PurR-regulated permease PerM
MQERTQSYLQFLLGLASIVIIIAGIRAVASVLNPILMALFIVIVSLPLTRWIEAKGLRKLRHPGRSRHLKGFLDVPDGALAA